jgi:ubiquinone/menaquinone biosynthesis C-methylase UbiE
MKKVESAGQLLAKHFSLQDMTVIDVGCGTGDLVRWLTGQGARAIGVDTPEMLAKAGENVRAGDEIYLAGGGEHLPVRSVFADLIIYSASLHHVPADRLDEALAECRRALKPGGRAAFIEPVARPGAYSEITRLTRDEAEVHRLAYDAILRAAARGMTMVIEDHFYYERSFENFQVLIKNFVAEEARRPPILEQARAITERLAAAKGVPFEDFRYRSICRLNILKR